MAIWSVLGKVFGFLAGGSKTAEKAVDMVDKAIYTKQEQAADTQTAVQVDQADLASARAMQMVSHSSWFDVVIDGLNRMVRPGVTLWIVGGFIGWWPLPTTNQVDIFWQNTFWIILTFWFGGRALLKDLPAAIRAMRG